MSLFTILFAKLSALLPTIAVFATEEGGDDVVTKTTNVINSIIEKVKAIATPVAVLAAIFCGIKLLIASDPGSVKSAKTWLLTIVIGLLVIYLASPLVNTVITILQ